MPSSHTEILFSPFRLRSLELPNRFVMAPMTRSAAPAGIPGAANAEYYRRRAEGGVGLILSEGTVIDRPASRNEPDIPLFYGDEALAGWRQVIDAVHASGGRMGPQLWHSGSTRSYQIEWEPDVPVESPSGLILPGQPRGLTMSEEDIADTVAAFARAAVEAQRLGFDLVEIHGAHGYLIDQFFWHATNLRDDRWGGASIRERARFGAEVVAAVRAAVGPDLPISMRISQWKQADFGVRVVESPAELEAWLLPLVEAGVDLIHCSQRRFWEPEFPEIDGEGGMNLAGWARKVTGAATISVGSVGLDTDFASTLMGSATGASHGLDALVERMERGEFDLIAIGRVLLSDPDWVAKIRHGDFDRIGAFDRSALLSLA